MANNPYSKLKHLYKVKVNFARRFTRGTLKGLDHQDSIPFISKELALDWVKGIQSNFDAGNLDYFLASWDLVENN